ncbi:hypothetical protein [Rhizobium rhizogenes]|uniref:hypothetical protein n=1 Tax=Rhizobium rhizogenes TaxID=359 RepID=UPI001AEE74CF|nr:hypothetical protein [Rhizobium rhizogenes]NTH31422.1 hypothetical protein [Rhizobium rhizogenes]
MHSRSTRRTSKLWLGVAMVLSWIALFVAIGLKLETAAVGVTVLIPAMYTAYTTIGHMDYRQALSNIQSPETVPQ